jgi:hypothetical protein
MILKMANEKWINIGIRVSLITVAAIIIIILITYYSKPNKQPVDNSDKAGIEKFNANDKFVKFADPVVSSTKTMEETPRKSMVPQSQPQPQPQPQYKNEPMVDTSKGPMPTDPYGMEDYIAVDYNQQPSPIGENAFFPQDRTKPEDLLPRDAANSKWAQVAPAGQGDVKNQNFLTAGYLVGKDTIGVAKKNPNLTLRAEPANPKTAVSPWMNSSIEPDQYRRGFEIGSSQ